MTETRKARLATDYREIMSMQGPLLSVKPLSGRPPYVDEYELTIRLRSITGPEPTYRSVHVVRISLPAGYPTAGELPITVMVTKPYPFHTNWFVSGRYCHGGSSRATEGLGNYVVRLMQVIAFHPSIIDVTSAANGTAAHWYQQNKRVKGLFPSDTATLPQPSVGGIVIKRINRP